MDVASKQFLSEPQKAGGIFVTFEGGDGAGKTTHIRFVAEALRAHGREVLTLREPGGTAVGEALRSVVLDPAHIEMDARTELLIYEAARAQIVAEVIRPALERGAVVLCDRFSDSTLAYQGYGRGLPKEFVEIVSNFATGGLVPDRTILLVCGDVRAGLTRATKNIGGDRLELAGEDFHTRVNKAFEHIAAREPNRIRVVHTQAPKPEVHAQVARELCDILPELNDALGELQVPPTSPTHSGASAH